MPNRDGKRERDHLAETEQEGLAFSAKAAHGDFNEERRPMNQAYQVDLAAFRLLEHGPNPRWLELVEELAFNALPIRVRVGLPHQQSVRWVRNKRRLKKNESPRR